MSLPVDQTIARLVADAKPIRRLPSPSRRALIWIPITLILLGALVWATGGMRVLAMELHKPATAIELIAAIVTGVLSMIAAFHLAVPDRSTRWAWLPIPTLALWVGTTVFVCILDGLNHGAAALYRGIGWPCFLFIAIVSIPLGVALMLMLRRGAPIAPVRAGLVGGLGVASFAGALLHSLHPFDGGIGDTGMHAVAIVAVVSAFGALARPALDRM